MLTNVQRECDILRNDLAATRVETAAVARNEGAACAREAEVVAARDNFRTKLTQARNSLICFLEWLSSGMPALLNIFDSILEQGGQGGTVIANQRF